MIRDQALELRILFFQRLEALRLTHLQPAVLLLPAIQRLPAQPVLPADLLRRRPRLDLLQDRDDLLFAVSTLPRERLFRALYPRTLRIGGSVQRYRVSHTWSVHGVLS